MQAVESSVWHINLICKQEPVYFNTYEIRHFSWSLFTPLPFLAGDRFYQYPSCGNQKNPPVCFQASNSLLPHTILSFLTLRWSRCFKSPWDITLELQKHSFWNSCSSHRRIPGLEPLSEASKAAILLQFSEFQKCPQLDQRHWTLLSSSLTLRLPDFTNRFKWVDMFGLKQKWRQILSYCFTKLVEMTKNKVNIHICCHDSWGGRARYA